MKQPLDIESLREGISGVIPSFGGLMADCAIFSLSSQGHRSGVKLTIVRNLETDEIDLEWATILGIWAARSMNDEARTTEFGAMGIGILLALRMTPYKHFTVAKRPSGIDFWLFDNEPESVDFSGANARLEISGIAKATPTNTLSARFWKKKEQVKLDQGLQLPTWIALIEFGMPHSLFLSL